MNPIPISRFTPLVAKLRSHPLLQRLEEYPPFRQRQFWVAVGVGLVVLIALGFWTQRAFRRAEMRGVLDAQAAFRNPPLQVMFPRLVSDTPANRALLEPGERMRFWSLQRRAENPARFEARVTTDGFRLFSVVGNQILATFRVGSREVVRVLDVEGDDRNRQVRFRYRWTELHPAAGVLGGASPEIGREYDGEALLAYENEQWRVLHWTTPLEDAIARFRALGSPASTAP